MSIDFRYKPVLFFVLTFAVSYAFYLAGAYLSFEGDGSLYMLFMIPGLMAPTIIALALILGSENRELRKDFARRLIGLRLIDPRMVPILLLMMPLVIILSTGLSVAFGGSAGQFRLSEEFSFSAGCVPVLAVLFLAATFEELGWRGYAFDSLRSRLGALATTLIFSLLWSLWHLPLVLVKNSYQYEILRENPLFALNFFISIVPMGIIISWICIRNRGSVLAAILFHFIINLSQEALRISQETKCIETALLSIIAAAIVMLDKATFPRRKTANAATTPSEPSANLAH